MNTHTGEQNAAAKGANTFQAAHKSTFFVSLVLDR